MPDFGARAVLASVFLLLCACVPPRSPAEIELDSQLEAKRVLLARAVGTHFWPNSPIGLCVRDTLAVGAKCTLGKGEFILDGVTPVRYPPAVWIHLKFETGLAGSFPLSVDEAPDEWLADHDILRDPTAYPLFLSQLKKKEADERRRLPGVIVGSLISDVPASAWGEPLQKQEKLLRGPGRYDYSIVDTWTYPKGAKIVFLDNRVFSIQR